MTLTIEQNTAFDSVLIGKEFQSIGPGVWRKGMVTASLQQHPTKVKIQHQCGLSYLDEKLYSKAAFNAVLAAIEHMDFQPTKNMIYLALAGASNPSHYLTTAKDELHVVCDPHVYGPAAVFKSISGLFDVNRNISVMNVPLNGRTIKVVAEADGDVYLEFMIGEQIARANVTPETASHVMTCPRSKRNTLASMGEAKALFEVLAFLAPSKDYTWRIVSKAMKPEIRGKATLALKKGSIVGIRKTADKFYVCELKDKDMVEYQIPQRVFDDINSNSAARRGKAPEIDGKAKKSHKKKADTSPRNKATTTKKAIVSPPTKPKRVVVKPEAAPAPAAPPSAELLSRYKEAFKGKEWTPAKLYNAMTEAGYSFAGLKTKTKGAIIAWLVANTGEEGLENFEAQGAQGKLKLKDKNVVDRLKAYDQMTLFRIANSIMGKDVPGPQDKMLAFRLFEWCTKKKVSIANVFDMLDQQTSKIDRQVQELRNPKKKINIPPAPKVSGSSPHGATIQNTHINTDPSKLPEGKERKETEDKIRKGTSNIYDLNPEKDTDATAALKTFINDLYAFGGSVISRGGMTGEENKKQWLDGKANMEDFRVTTHPHIVSLDKDSNPIVCNDSTQYFFEKFAQHFQAGSSPVKIKEIKHHKKGELNEYVDVIFHVKKYTNVLLYLRLMLNPDPDKYSTADQGYARNMRVAKDPAKLTALAKSQLKYNMTVAAVSFNPIEGVNHETYRILASLI